MSEHDRERSRCKECPGLGRALRDAKIVAAEPSIDVVLTVHDV